MNALADACPACFPGDAPAAIPANARTDEDGAITADYQCPLCGFAWATRWKIAGAFPETRIYRAAIPLMDDAIRLLVDLLDGEELEAV